MLEGYTTPSKAQHVVKLLAAVEAVFVTAMSQSNSGEVAVEVL